MRQKLFALLATVLVFAAGVNAQNVKVSGTVSDNAGPVVGASILVKGTTEGTITDVDGKYSISVPANATLVVSFIGYQTEEVAVGGRSVLDITLKEDSELLSESVVLGYGIATKKKDLSASVGVVASPEKLAAHPVTSTEAMLQGAIPGVTVTADGGSPDSTPSIVIRGQGSKNGDSVLWVVDGIPGAPINSLSDIESIVVLKDAASAAIYGAQSGAGGVILVTTKKAQKGVSVSYDGLVGARSAAKLIEPLDAAGQIEMHQRAYQAANQTIPADWDVTKNPYIGTTRTKWMDEIFRTAIYHRHNVVLNAGTDKAKNRLSFSAEDNDGILQNTYKRNMGINYRGEFQINDYIKLSEDLSWRQWDSKGTDTNSGYTGSIISAIFYPSSADKYMYDGSGWGGVATQDPEYIAAHPGAPFSGPGADLYNPLHNLYRTNHYGRNNSLYTTTSLEIGNLPFIKGLKFVSRFTFYVDNAYNKNFNEAMTELGRNDPNSLDISTSRNQGWKTENTLTYDRTFGKHTVGALVSTTADTWSGKGFSVNGKKFDNEDALLQYMAMAGESSVTGDYLSGPDANVAFIGRLSYSYDDRYFVTASFRRDQAGRLPKDHNGGNFPAVTGAWKISSEPFFQKNDVLNLLKLRASWGRIGNLGSVGMNYKSATLSDGKHLDEGIMYGVEVPNHHSGYWYYLSKALNNQLTWETSEQIDLGLDISMFSDRLSFSADFYNKRTYNLIQEQASGWPSTIGISAMQVNLGEVMNRGIEMQLGWSDKKGNWSYFVNGNAAYNKNWVSDIGVVDENGNKGVWDHKTGGLRQIPNFFFSEEGQPLRSYYMIECLGIFQNQAEIDAYTNTKGEKIQPNAKPGDLKFKDADNSGSIDLKDRKYFGNAAPDWTFALNAGFTWKNLSVSAMFQGVQGAQAAYVGKYLILNDCENDYNRSSEILNAWTPENPSSNIPRLCKTDANGNFSTPSTWYLEDASYIRLKNVTVSYDLTSLIRKSSHLGQRGSALSVYFSGENLFTITKYSGLDPECGGWDCIKYPVSRVLSFGVKLTY